MKRAYLAAALVTAMAASVATAEDRAMPIMHNTAAVGAETVSVDIRTADGPLWSGTLTLGPQYGNAYFSQSKNEYAEPCADKPIFQDGISNSNSSLSVNISRNNWQQEPDKFNVTFSWTRALQACEGQGNDTFGFNRVVDIKPGQSVTIEGAMGTRVTITRAG